MIIVTFEPLGQPRELSSANTVLQLLNKLDRRPGETLVIRDGKLLTPDVKLFHDDAITLRDVTSRG